MQAKRAAEARARYVEPTTYEIDYVLYEMEQRYKAARWELSPDWDTRESFERALRRLDMQSSPGIPLMREAPTNGDWLRWEGCDGCPIQKDRLWLMVQDVMAGKYHHFWRVFIKEEPHKPSKAEEGRWRLIIAASLPVQIAWQMTFGKLNDKFIDTCFKTPSMQGLVYVGGGYKQFRTFCRMLQLRTCIDKSAWDFNSPGWVYFQVCLPLRRRLCINPTEKWLQVATALYEDAYHNSVLQLEDGTTYQQLFRGFMKSGVVNTISDNSLGQVALHALAEKRLFNENDQKRMSPILATGDDTIQRRSGDQYLDELEKAGCIVKECNDGYEFMGFDLNEDFKPMYPTKHLVSIMHQKQEFVAQVLDSYMRMYIKTPWASGGR